jgi:purine nucleosidase
MRTRHFPVAGLIASILFAVAGLHQVVAQGTARTTKAERIFIDTDIGDDVDDAFALMLALKNPKVEIVGISGAWGDTELRARMIERLLRETGHSGIPVGAGVKTKSTTAFSQQEWAEGGAVERKQFPDGVRMLRDAILKYPGQLTLVAIAPLTNIGALIDLDAATFRKLKRVVIMGGSIYKGYEPGGPPSAEYNILMDVGAAQKLFASGVPVSVMPLDSTTVQMTEAKRAELYRQDTVEAKILKELDREWSAHQTRAVPTLFDVVAVAAVIDPKVCPVTPMRLTVDDKGFTRPVVGKANADVCLKLNEERFFKLYYGSLMDKKQ